MFGWLFLTVKLLPAGIRKHNVASFWDALITSGTSRGAGRWVRLNPLPQPAPPITLKPPTNCFAFFQITSLYLYALICRISPAYGDCFPYILWDFAPGLQWGLLSQTPWRPPSQILDLPPYNYDVWLVYDVNSVEGAVYYKVAVVDKSNFLGVKARARLYGRRRVKYVIKAYAIYFMAVH